MTEPKQYSVLNVDDDDAARYAKTRILQAAGYDVLEARSGTEALLLTERMPQLVLLDAKLPDISGIEVCRRTKANPATRHIMVLLVSAASVSGREKAESLEQGADSCVTEPIEPQELLGWIKALLRLYERESENRRLLAQQRESEEKFRTLADSSPTMIWVTDAKGRIEFVNSAYCEFLGVTVEKVKQEGWEPLIHAEDAHQYVSAYYEALRDAKPFRAEARVRRVDGEWRWVDSKGLPRLSASGEFLGHVGSSPDVTEIKLSQAAQRRRNQGLRLLNQASAELLTSNDPQQMIERLFARVSDYLGADLFFNHMVDGSEPDGVPLLRLEAAGGVSESARQAFASVHIGESICGTSAQDQSVVYVPDVQRSDEPIASYVYDLGVRAYVCLPLMVGERLIGTLSFGSRQKDHFDEDELDFLRTLSYHVASAKQWLRAAQSLRRSEAEFRAVFELAAIGRVQIDPKTGRYLRVNDKLCEMLGYSRGELIGKSFLDVTHPDDRGRNWEAVQPFLRGETPNYTIEKRFLRKDGGIVWCSVIASMVTDSAGAPLATVSDVMDISDRKRAEEALRESEERLRLAQVSAGIGSWDLNLQTGELIWSPENCRLYGLAPVDFIPKYETWRERIHPDDLPRAVRERKRCIAARVPYQIEYRILRPSGEMRWISTHGKAFYDETGIPTRVLGISFDITERKRMEGEIHQHVEALKEADRRKDEFLATLAHELRNPLGPIHNAAETLSLCESIDPDFEWCRAVIQNQVKHLSRLVDDLLDISRITRGKLTLIKEQASLGEIINASLEATRAIIEKRGHELRVILPSEPVYLNVDRVRFSQVLTNLISNAAKYTSERGRIGVIVDLQEDEIVIRVSDNGVGISPEKLRHVFDLFYQVSPSYEQGQTGLGIGLSLVKRLVEMHGGKVEVNSAGAGQGSEFIVRLPITSNAGESPRLSQSDRNQEQACAPPGRILVADDYPRAAESLARRLHRMGYDVQTALDGLQAVERAAKFRPDVVLLDLGMPNLDGYEAARMIRDQPWGKRMVLIALTGWGQEEHRRRTRDAGFDAHLVKPLDMTALEEIWAKFFPTNLNHTSGASETA